MPNGDDNPGNNKKREAFAQGVGFVVFSGIALSILKSLSPFNRRKNETLTQSTQPPHTLTQSTQPILDTSLPPPPIDPIITKVNTTQPHPLPLIEFTPPPLPLEPITQKPYMDQNVLESSHKTVEIARGDTLWGLSRQYGVSIDAIKEANGLSGDTIQVGKKLIIP